MVRHSAARGVVGPRAPRLLAPALVLLTTSCAGPPDRGAVALAAGASTALRKLHDLARSEVVVVAHRGDSAEFPENTLPAFASAVARGAPVVELDFYATRDGHLVCCHDTTLDRTTNAVASLGRKGIKPAELTLGELRQLDAGSWKNARFAGTALPTLSEALDAIQPGAITMIERKEGEPLPLIELLQAKGLVDHVLVQSFDWEWLARLHELEPRLALAALCGDPLNPERLERLRQTGAAIAHWDARKLEAPDVSLLHRNGFLVCAYTIDDDLSLLGARAFGLDAVTTNRPLHAREVMGRGRGCCARAVR